MKANYPDSNIKLIESGGGVFDVKCDGKLIYSRKNNKRKRFPIEGEITKLIKQAIS